MLNQTDLRELKKGDIVAHFLLIRRSELRNTRAGKAYLSLELGDKTASLNANLWDNFETIANSAEVGNVVKVDGFIEEFQENLQIRVTSIRVAKSSDKVSPKDFLPKSDKNLDEMINEFNARIEAISDSHLKSLITNIMSGEQFENFTTAPAGKFWHHGYIHGLLEHTLEIIKICDLICDLHPELNRDLLISGAILHDLGKTEELTYDDSFEYTDKGKLIGHIVLAATKVEEETKKITGFPEKLKNNLIHLILSHQGKLEHSSPVVPKTLEAIALYHADELSAKVNAYKNALISELKGDSKWTRFINLAQTDLYKHEISTEIEKKNNKSLFD